MGRSLLLLPPHSLGEEVTNCLDILGHLPWPEAVPKFVSNVVKTKVTKLQGANMLPIKRPKMFQLQILLPAIASVDFDGGGFFLGKV